MSSKKQIRRERRKREQQKKRGKLNPATLFMLAIGLILLAVVAGAYFLGEPEPPRPGAVWSPEHQHWH